MKKLIAILAVFAFMTAALFAQDAGTWSLSGSGQIGTQINFVPLLNNADKMPPANHAQVYANNYGIGDVNSNGDIRGNLTIGYKKGIITAQISFNQRGAMGANFQADGENFQFRASKDLAQLFNGTGSIGDLWGNYTFSVLQGITLELAVNKESEQWTVENILGDSPSKNIGGKRDYLLLNAKPIVGLEVGFKLPNVFNINNYGNTNFAAIGAYTDNSSDPSTSVLAGSQSFLDDTLRRMVFGVKYSTGPVGVAFQFALNRYGLDRIPSVWDSNKKALVPDYGNNGIRLEAKYTINGQMWAALDFKGVFGHLNATDKDGKAIDSAEIGFGAKFSYSAAPLNADLTLKFVDSNTSQYFEDGYKRDTQTFTIGANVGYVIMTGLQAKLGVELGIPIWGSKAVDASKDAGSVAHNMSYQFTPELIYTFGPSSISVGYRVAGRAEQTNPAHNQNHLNIMFKWSF